MRYVKRQGYDFWIQTDLDGTCVFSPTVIRSLERRTEYDILSFTPDMQNYWDLWALRASWYHKSTVNRVIGAARRRGDVLEVDSAFMMLSVYRMATLNRSSCEYGWLDVDHRIDCEHAVFHLCLRRDLGLRIGILPETYCAS